MLSAIIISIIVFFTLGSIIGYILQLLTASNNFENPLIEKINSILPQTQCAQCGYPGCKPYATAIITEQAKIDLCPPGGAEAVQAIADILGTDIDKNSSLAKSPLPPIAIINEELCIGCTKCIPVCPTDAIIGAAKSMHTVIPEYCTGCELCISPCPVDCITIITPETTPHMSIPDKPYSNT